MDGYTLGLMQLEFGNIEFYALFLDRILYNSRVEKVQQGYKDNTQKKTDPLSPQAVKKNLFAAPPHTALNSSI